MKLMNSIAIVAITLGVAACNKTQTQNAAEDNSVNASAPAANETDMNAAVENNVAAPEANATGNGDKTDTGPRG